MDDFGFNSNPFGDRNGNGMYDPMDQFEYETYNGTDEEMLEEMGSSGRKSRRKGRRKSRSRDSSKPGVLLIVLGALFAIYPVISVIMMAMLDMRYFFVYLGWTAVMIVLFRFLFRTFSENNKAFTILLTVGISLVIIAVAVLYTPFYSIFSEAAAYSSTGSGTPSLTSVLSPLFCLPLQAVIGFFLA
ncbi:MAG: hypothetical protein VB031_06485 [Eubacteriaceae bacterium]|nr:hypothetical protein [Eubacteriaceae bacterium]